MFHVKHYETTPPEDDVPRETLVNIHPMSTGCTYTDSVHPNTTEQGDTPS
jgi:hypothetical protein